MQTYTKVLFVGFIASLLLSAAPAFASDGGGHSSPVLNWESHLKKGNCSAVGAPIVDVTEAIKNDVDSGVAGNNWAFDIIGREIKIWNTTTAGTYCADVSYVGAFKAIAGQTAPAGTGTLSGKEQGTFDGGYQATITGTLLSHPLWKKFGSVGVFDYKCDVSGNCPGYVNWVTQYFPSDTSNLTWWGWIYHGGKFGTWINAISGNSGNIL